MFQREIDKLEKDIGGIQDMNALPDAMFVIDVGYHKIAVAEAQEARHPGDRRGRHQPLARGHRLRDPRQRRLGQGGRAVRARRRRRGARRQGQRRATTSCRPRPASDEFVEVERRRPDRRTARARTDKGLLRRPLFSSRDSRRINERSNDDGSNHRKHGRRTAREDRRADDGVQEGADRGRRRHGQGRGDPARQARQQGRQGRVAHHRRRRGRRVASTARPARWSRSTARPTSSPRTTTSSPSPRPRPTLVAENNPADVAALSALPLRQDGFGPTLEDVRKGLIGKIGENMSIRRFKRYAGGGKLAQLPARHAHRRAGRVRRRRRRGQGRGDAHRGDEAGGAVAGRRAGRADREGARASPTPRRRAEAGQAAVAEIVAKMVEGSVQKYLKEVSPATTRPSSRTTSRPSSRCSRPRHHGQGASRCTWSARASRRRSTTSPPKWRRRSLRPRRSESATRQRRDAAAKLRPDARPARESPHAGLQAHPAEAVRRGADGRRRLRHQPRDHRAHGARGRRR